MPKIKFCYEAVLGGQLDLHGKVTVHFVIDGTGAVASAKATSDMNGDARVPDCVVKVLKGVPFPEPKGGGLVFVTYPFVFSSSG